MNIIEEKIFRKINHEAIDIKTKEDAGIYTFAN